MGTEKNLQFSVYIIDTVLLTVFMIGFYKLTCHIVPDWVSGIDNFPQTIFIYIISFSFSSFLFPSLVPVRLIKTEAIITRVILTCFMMLLFAALFFHISSPFKTFPRAFFFHSIIAFLFLLLIEQLFLKKILTRMRAKGKNLKNVVFIGNEATVYQLYEKLKNSTYGYKIIGFFYDGKCDNEEIAALRLGGVSDIYGWLSSHPEINEIYGYFPKEQHDTINMMSKFCDNHLIRFYYIPAINVFKSNMNVSFMDEIPVISRHEEPLRNGINKWTKRIFDIIFSLLILLCVFPWVLLLVTIMVKIQSPGPIFIFQERTGLDGKVFRCIKFRSLNVNNVADESQAMTDDSQRFAFGDFIHKMHIDELPQFLNVLIGEMSVVGPCPYMVKHTSECSRITSRFMVCHFAKPGITGLAQVTGFRGEMRHIGQMEGRIKKDIEYMEHWTFLLDLKIIAKTLVNMFRGNKGNAD